MLITGRKIETATKVEVTSVAIGDCTRLALMEKRDAITPATKAPISPAEPLPKHNASVGQEDTGTESAATKKPTKPAPMAARLTTIGHTFIGIFGSRFIAQAYQAKA